MTRPSRSPVVASPCASSWSTSVIGALIGLVALLAAWDDGMGAVLGALPGAEPLAAPALGVALSPDGVEVRIEIGDDGPRLVAALAGAFADGELPAAVREHL